MGMDIGSLYAVHPRAPLSASTSMISSRKLCGARLTFNYMRIGGVAWDLPPDWVRRRVAFLDRFEAA